MFGGTKHELDTTMRHTLLHADFYGNFCARHPIQKTLLNGIQQPRDAPSRVSTRAGLQETFRAIHQPPDATVLMHSRSRYKVNNNCSSALSGVLSRTQLSVSGTPRKNNTQTFGEAMLHRSSRFVPVNTKQSNDKCISSHKVLNNTPSSLFSTSNVFFSFFAFRQ